MFSYCNNRILCWHLGRQMYSPCCKEPNRLILVFVVAFCVQKDLKISQPMKITFFEIVSLCHVSFHYFRVILFVVVEGWLVQTFVVMTILWKKNWEMILPVITGNEKKIWQFYTYGVAKVVNFGLINGSTESMVVLKIR